MNRTSLTNPQIYELAASIHGTIRKAREIFDQSDFTVDKKADGSPVTSIDTRIQRLLKFVCRQHLGNSIHYVAEEDEDQGGPGSEVWWVFIDPIDGTTPLCAGDPDNAHIAVGIFLNGEPYLGFVANLGNLGIVFGGVGLGKIIYRDAEGIDIGRKEISPRNKMCCIDLASGPAADPVMSNFILQVVADRTLGGYPYNVPSIASAMKLIMGHAKFFIGSNSKPWDVAAIMAMLPLLGYTFTSLETSEPITLDGSRRAVPAFVISTEEGYKKRLITLYNQIRLAT